LNLNYVTLCMYDIDTHCMEHSLFHNWIEVYLNNNSNGAVSHIDFPFYNIIRNLLASLSETSLIPDKTEKVILILYSYSS